MDYRLLDTGQGEKLEQFGAYTLIRPAAQACWERSASPTVWNKADARFTRDKGNRWQFYRRIPEKWTITIDGLSMQLSPTDFGHIGIFPEQQQMWQWVRQQVDGQPLRLLNLFAYSGGMSLAAAQAGALVCHVDASKGMVDWANQNAALNGIETVRWIVDDVIKFCRREERRGNKYDAIVLDPPSFGRGNRGELFKIEKDLIPLLKSCRNLLVDKPHFFLLSCHTPGFTPLVLHHTLEQLMQPYQGQIEALEMAIPGSEGTCSLPSGAVAKWW